MTNLAKTAMVSITRHRAASAVAVATLAFMLSALTIFVLLASGLGNAASGLESKAELIAYLNHGTPPSRVSKIETSIQSQWHQAQIQYVSPRQALTNFKHSSLGKDLGSALEGNPLPASLDIHTPNPSTLSQIASSLSSRTAVHNVLLNRDLTNKLVEISTVVTVSGTALILGLALLSLVIVMNTTHLSIDARKEELEVMRLIGATHAFVRNPLIVEGMMLGLAGSLVAAVIGIGVFLPIVHWLLSGSSTLAALLPISSSANFVAPLSACVLITGAGIGALGSYVSVRRFAGI